MESPTDKFSHDKASTVYQQNMHTGQPMKFCMYHIFLKLLFLM